MLFADLVGFTGLAETRDPEQVKNLVDTCFQRLVSDVTVFGGQVDKIVGDAIVALFGAPVAHEDDAERAVRAALRMQETLAREAPTVGAAGLRLRIGVNTGEVLVGALRAGGAVTAMGDVVNIASRLQVAAEPGRVVVGPATHAATSQVVRYEPVGAIRAKGREEPIEAWMAVEALGPPGWRPVRRRASLVGRGAELALVGQAFDLAVQHGRAQLMLLIGEAGVGKSRLADELAELAADESEALVLEGRCVPYGEANVWWPLAEAVRCSFGVGTAETPERARSACRAAVTATLGPDADPAEVSRVVDGLQYLLGDEGLFGDLDPTRLRDEVAWAVQTYLEAWTRRRPVVLVVSDLHWADDPVLEVLGRLLAHLGGRPFVLVGTTREPLVGRWSPPAGRHNTLALHVDPLDPEASAELVEALLGDGVPAEVRQAVVARSGGNPFYIEELATLFEAGRVGDGGGVSVAAAEVPDTLRGLVAARLDGLPASERSLLETAAVVGRTGAVHALQVLAGGTADVAVGLDGLATADVLEVVDDRWRFRSDLLREVAYGRLTKADRARRHAAVASLLAAEPGADDRAEQIAQHAAAAAEMAAEVGGVDGVPDDLAPRAVSWLERAAVRSEGREGVSVTVRLVDRALALLGGDGAAARRRLLLVRARARAGARDLVGARTDVAEVLEEAAAVGDAENEARAITQLGDLLTKEGEPDRAVDTLARAVELWRALGDRRGEAEALRLRGFADLFRERQAPAEHAFAEALALSREVGDRRGEAWAMQNLAWISFERGNTTEADRRLHEAATVFAEIGDHGGIGWALGLLGWVRLQQGRFEEAEQLARLVRPKAGAQGDRWGEGMMIILLGLVHLWQGRAGAALDEGRAATALFAEINDRWGRTQAAAVEARALLALGRVAEGRRTLERLRSLVTGNTLERFGSVVLAQASVQVGAAGPALAALHSRPGEADEGLGGMEGLTAAGLAHLQLGRVDEAVAALEHARDLAGGRPDVATMAALALAYVGLGRLDDAVALAAAVGTDERATYLDRVGARVALALGQTRAGRPAEARASFSLARAEADATEDRLAQALVRLAEAEALEAQGSPMAVGALAEAGSLLERLGLESTGWRTAFRLAAGGEA